MSASPTALRPRFRQLSRLLTRLIKIGRLELYAFWRRRPVNRNAVMYESFAGNGMLCNPEAIFRGLRSAEDFSHLSHVWVLSSRKENTTVVREFAGDTAVRFVRPGSAGYYRALATSGYLINNATFPPEFGKRPEQVYVNTWHGTPLKKMGYDIGDPASRVGNVIRNFLAADYLLAANHFMAEQLYESAHLLRGIYRGRIIEEGYPRIDHQFTGADGADRARAHIEASGIPVGNRRIILYAPTWKGESFARPRDDAAELLRRVVELESRIDTTRYVVVLKTHQVIHRFDARRREFSGRLIPNEIPTNVVLSATDILVTDYSSTFFDFLASGRPVVFFAPDVAEYAGYRGLYLEPQDWPGAVVQTIDAVAREITALETDGQRPEVLSNYRNMRERFASHEDGCATSRIIDIVFRGKTRGQDAQPIAGDDRVSVLISAGSMHPNGITSAALNLLSAIDHARFDVTIIFPDICSPRVLENHRQIDPAVRQLVRVGGMNGSKLTHLRRRFGSLRGDLHRHKSNAAQKRLWDDEWIRCFGSSRFDIVVDFSGYNSFWACLLLHSPDARRMIWAHNDLAADARRTIRGRQPLRRNLDGVFSLYRDYDNVVSVAPTLATINATNLAAFARRDRFISAANLVNAPRVLANAAVDLVDAVEPSDTGTVPGWATALAAAPSSKTFVTVGRLSPEKNHARLIRAFAAVHRSDADARLIVVGDGPLLGDLEGLILDLGLSEAVTLAGHQCNPHSIMVRAGCFVLSSDYEGQPMVVLEALLLGLPVVTVAYASVGDVFPPGCGLVVPATDAGLSAGMQSFLRGEVPAQGFDGRSYNDEALEQFYAAIGVEALAK